MKTQSRKNMIREYKERKKPAGVFVIKNIANGKILLGSSLNLEGIWNSASFQLNVGSHRNRALQEDWKKLGADTFVFEVLAQVKVKDDPGFNLDDELKVLEELWFEELKPVGERGYNENRHIRQA